jgi:cell division protein FtsB
MAGARFLDPASVPLRRHGDGGNIWATLATATQVIIGVVAFSGLLLFFVPVIDKTQQYQADQVELRANIDKALEDQQQLKLETEHMKTDSAYVEHIARDQLNMGKAGEYIVSFPPYQALPLTRKVVHPTPQNDDGDGGSSDAGN